MPALLGVLAAVFLDLFGLGLIRPILPLYVQSTFGVDVLRVSWIPAAFGIGKLLADIPAGLLMDRLGRRRMMAAGLVLVAVVDVLSAVEAAFHRFLLWRMLAGLGFGFFVTTAATVVLDLAPATGRGRHMGSYLLIGDLGSVAGAGAGGWLYDRFGTGIPFFAKAAMAATAAWIAGGVTLAAGAKAPSHPPAAGPSLRVPGLLPIAVLNMILFMADVGVIALLLPLLLDAAGLAPHAIGLLVAAVAATQLGTLFVASRVADRWDKRAVLVPALLLYATGLAILASTLSMTRIIPAVLAVGAGSGMARWIPLALVGDLVPPSSRAAAMGIFRAFTDVGMIVGPTLLGLLAHTFGNPVAILTVAGLLLVGGGVTVPMSRRACRGRAD